MAAESIKVVVRCRPMNDREHILNCKMVVSVEMSRCQCFIKKPGAKEEPPKQFTFDGTYFIDQTTEQMYNDKSPTLWLSENFASNYFKPKRVNQLLGVEPLKGLAVHSASQGNGTPHLTSSGSNIGPNIGPSLSAESLLPHPFCLESLGITPSNGKVKRMKNIHLQ
ncbi:unnamed protein product [Coregonus sp. 'balchen']|nr:unnamed protein product [Coregonus sp. 'balchen']